ncbi:MAG: hypothetical protein JWM93_3698 [Frankiales bacterium]|nr:hypothetical protein [Frankiales bacterium]
MRTAFMGLTSSCGVTAPGTLSTRTRSRQTVFLSTDVAGRHCTHLGAISALSAMRHSACGQHEPHSHA